MSHLHFLFCKVGKEKDKTTHTHIGTIKMPKKLLLVLTWVGLMAAGVEDKLFTVLIFAPRK